MGGHRPWFLGACAGAAALLLAGCAASHNDLAGHPGAAGTIAGFWLGLWHGLIAPIVWIVSLFTDRVSIYEVHNSGGWYDFGFLLGVSAVLGGGSSLRTRSQQATRARASGA